MDYCAYSKQGGLLMATPYSERFKNFKPMALLATKLLIDEFSSTADSARRLTALYTWLKDMGDAYDIVPPLLLFIPNQKLVGKGVYDSWLDLMIVSQLNYGSVIYYWRRHQQGYFDKKLPDREAATEDARGWTLSLLAQVRGYKASKVKVKEA
jgi:hypothetical protein